MSPHTHVAHAVLTLGVGGLERIVLSLVCAGLQRGQRVSLLCVEQSGALAPEAQAAGAHVVALAKPPGRWSAFQKRAEVVIRDLAPDVIHTHQIGAAWYTGGAARGLGGPPVLHTEHGNEFARSLSWWKSVKARLFFHQTARFIDKFCCVSGEIADAITRWWTVPPAKVEVVPNGIQTDARPDLPTPIAVRASLGIPEGVPVVGTVGRLSEVKRQDLLVRAIAKLQATIPDVRLLLVGDGPERAKLEALVREAGLSDRTHFVGYQSCPEQYLQIMSVFALTSRSEGFPVSLLEAWLAGVPAVCSAVGGIPGVVTHERDGLLFSPNDEAALVSSLIRVIKDKALRERLVEAGGRIVRVRYSLERMATDYETRYRELIAARGGTG